MAVRKQNRIYLECRNYDSYRTEIMEAFDMNDESHVIIWDQTELEEKCEGEELFSLYLTVNKVDDHGNKIFDRTIWIELVKFCWNKGIKFINFGCWSDQKELVDEARSLNAIKVEERSEQLEFYYKIGSEIKIHILCNYLDTDGDIKWFNFGLYSELDINVPTFYSAHFGTEYYINDLEKREVEEIISIVEKNNIYVRINRQNKK